MACEGFETRLIEKALADTDPALTAHLAKCADCRADYAAQRALQERITNGIAAMVSDEPSSALLTRVRAQIAAESSPRSGNWMQWLFAGVTVAAFAAVSMWMIGRPSRRLSGAQNSPAQSASNASSLPATPPKQVASQIPVQQKLSVVHEHRQVRTLSHPSAPIIVPAAAKVSELGVAAAANNQSSEIIVPAGQREAVLRLVNALRTGRVDAASLIRTNQPGEIAPLVTIPPLEIKPLNGGGGDGSEMEFEIEF